MRLKKLCSIIESMLFVEGESMSLSDIVKAVREIEEEEAIDKNIVREALLLLEKRYFEEESGLSLLMTKDTIRLATRPENHLYVELMTVKRKKRSLTQSVLETLSIIAYRQPVTKLEVEDIRGVKSDYPIRILLEYGLIEEAGRLDKIGKPILYRTTSEFLTQFGLKDIKDMPKFSSFVEETQNVSMFETSPVDEDGEKDPL
ncbi:MAG: SMC-Scp complex subunit ScpB [Filifactor alocis]|nr:SMC-Scp complex subunit ScpB [Filifactor alocis]